MPGNTDAGQNRISTASYHLLQYLLRVFKSRDRTISRAVIHGDDHRPFIRSKKSMKASSCEFAHTSILFPFFKEHEGYLIIPDVYLVKILPKYITRGQFIAEMGDYPYREGCSQASAINQAQPLDLGCNERSEEHTSELQSHSDVVCRLLLKK